MQFLIATLAGLQVPSICSETRELGEELVGSYLYQVHLYHWLEPTTTAGFYQTTIYRGGARRTLSQLRVLKAQTEFLRSAGLL